MTFALALLGITVVLAVWGVALVDFARHAARAWAEGAGRDPGAVMHEIRAAFDDEWERPTDLGRGHLKT